MQLLSRVMCKVDIDKGRNSQNQGQKETLYIYFRELLKEKKEDI